MVKKTILNKKRLAVGNFLPDLSGSKELFNDLWGYISPIDTGKNTTPSAQDQDIESKRQTKLGYMTIALICSQWEDLVDEIKHSYPSYRKICKSPTTGKSSKFYTLELEKVGEIRNCIMHGKGKVLADRGKSKNVDIKYIGKDGRIFLERKHVLEFFDIFEQASIAI